MRSILSKLNRPLPAWATVLLFMVVASSAAAAPMIWKGSVSVPTGGSLTTAGGVGPTFGGTATVSNPSANSTVAVTAQGTNNANIIVSTTAKTPNIQLQYNSASMGNLNQVGNLYFFNNSFTHGEMGDLEYGSCCVTAGDMGSFFAILTKLDDGSGTMVENITGSPGGHLSEGYDNISVSVSSPASCAALTSCSTFSYTFTHPFITTAGAAEVPYCGSPGIQDNTSPSTIWLSNVNSITATTISTIVTFNYAPTTAVTGSHSLKAVFTCHNSGF